MNRNDKHGAPTGASAESGSLVSVEGQTDEGLREIAYRAAHDFYDKNGPGKLSLSATRQAFLAALRAKSEKPQSSGKEEAGNEALIASTQGHDQTQIAVPLNTLLDLRDEFDQRYDGAEDSGSKWMGAWLDKLDRLLPDQPELEDNLP